jgi:Zn/Cd-binding protein ZinT
MKYKVHRLDVDSNSMQEKLERYLNDLKGEVISVIPNLAKTTLSQIYGVKSKVDFLLIVEKL